MDDSKKSGKEAYAIRDVSFLPGQFWTDWFYFCVDHVHTEHVLSFGVARYVAS